MKKKLFISLIVGLAMCSHALLAQQNVSDYKSTMKGLMIKMDTASDVQMNLKVASDFNRVGEVAKTEWHPFYYAAFCNVLAALDIEDVTKVDPLCDIATVLLEKAEKMSPKNSEIYCVKAMISLARIKVNVFQRGMEALGDAQASLESAQELNPDNPRVYLLLGQQSYNTPEAFGGSKKNALVLFEKAKVLLDKQDYDKDNFEPTWGIETTIKKIESCKKHLQNKVASNKE